MSCPIYFPSLVLIIFKKNVDNRHTQIMTCTHMKERTHKGIAWNIPLLDTIVEESP